MDHHPAQHALFHISQICAGVSGSTVVVNLASSRAAVRDGMATVTPLVHHLVEQLQEYSV